VKPKSFMVIAGEASGDVLAAELVRAIREELAETAAVPTSDYQPLQTSLEPRFFGAGGTQMAAAGVEMALDMTVHSVLGLFEALAKPMELRRLFRRLFKLALERQPDVIICVDFSEFNLLFAQAIRRYARAHADCFHDWSPRMVRYPSPQVWAAREGRVYRMARDFDLVLSIFPFEKDWYAKRVPQLRVEFVGHPIVDRYPGARAAEGAGQGTAGQQTVLLLPGSRRSELRRHLPVMLEALALLHAKVPNLRARMVLPKEDLFQQAKALRLPAMLEVQLGGLPQALATADVAIASTGTVTMECAYFGMPTVALYKTSWLTFQIARQMVKVKYLAMPNLLANEAIFPEFIQGAATADNLTNATLELLRDAPRRARVKAQLAQVVASLGAPGAARRAARAVLATLAAKTLPAQ
jgi:lipid-A-disaccharide synthase